MFNFTTLLLQIILILCTARFVGRLFRRFGQPQVMGEMMAGILLGPSLFGWLAPGAFKAVFPPQSLDFINALSQVGLVIFMFQVGLELDPRVLRRLGHRIITISNASIIVPFVLGVFLAVFLKPVLAKPGVTSLAFMLFFGAAMSITAFPVLARILRDHHLLHTQVGTLAIACAAINDVSGWCILAGLLATVKSAGSIAALWLTLILTLLYLAVMICIVKPLAHRFHQDTMSQDRLAVIIIIALASGLTTQWIGIHPLFGAFVAGAIMPKHEGFNRALSGRLYDSVVVLLLPMFFVYTGLRTKLGLLDQGWMWGVCGIIILVAIAGKFGGSTISARLAGIPWREAGALGTLMNARGLMELVLLNIGLEIGVISQTVFTMLVIMAIVTTLMTAPILDRFHLSALAEKDGPGSEIENSVHAS
jgi:Kef-type K+ transport system membrane component KefB